ncbi:hypothetical protein [Myxosarcina sp. GI1(2024)]
MFWPVAIPLSLLELKTKANKKARDKAFTASSQTLSLSNGEIRYIKAIEQTEESTKNTSSPAYGK